VQGEGKGVNIQHNVAHRHHIAECVASCVARSHCGGLCTHRPLHKHPCALCCLQSATKRAPHCRGMASSSVSVFLFGSSTKGGLRPPARARLLEGKKSTRGRERQTFSSATVCARQVRSRSTPRHALFSTPPLFPTKDFGRVQPVPHNTSAHERKPTGNIVTTTRTLLLPLPDSGSTRL
jgi:hypothetical protein